MSINKVYRMPWSHKSSYRNAAMVSRGSLHLTRYGIASFISINDKKSGSIFSPDFDPLKDAIPIINVSNEVMMVLSDGTGSMWEPVGIRQ